MTALQILIDLKSGTMKISTSAAEKTKNEETEEEKWVRQHNAAFGAGWELV